MGGEKRKNHSIRIKLAQSRDELESAFRLLQKAHFSYGLSQEKSGLWLNKHHALPSTNTFIAVDGDEVVGAICLFGESAMGLPLEAEVSLLRLRASLNGRIAEISIYGVQPEVPNKEELAYALFHYAVCFSATFCCHSLLITRAPPELHGFYTGKLGFCPFLTNDRPRGTVMTLQVLDASDNKNLLMEEIRAEYEFPEKKFFLVHHHVMRPELLDYFFNRSTRVFAQLNDLELRALRNIYSYGKYVSILPRRESSMTFTKLPKYKRYEMSCEGYLRLPNSRKINFQVYDVSANGLKIQTEEALRPGEVYMLNISIGVTKNAEVIAKSVWVRKDLNQVGLEVHSADQNWKKLISYLESDFHQQAA